ncbi:MAG: hypothetical protein AAGG38_00330 [Planctomycetota bacterium]
MVLQLAAELLDAVGQEYRDATPYEKGEIAGRAVFEIVSTFVPIAGQVGKVTKATKLDFLTALANKPLFQSGKPLAALNATQASVGAIPSGLGGWGPLFGRVASTSPGSTKLATLILTMRKTENNSAAARRTLDNDLTDAVAENARARLCRGRGYW